MFLNSKNIVINDGTFISNTSSGLHGIDRLQEHIASGAFHNSAERYDPPKCHPQTRVAVLETIMKWAKDDQSTSLIKWLYGSLGSGKSAIAQTIAEMCHELGILAASFFWSRSATGRNNEERLISSLAYQLAIAIPDLRIHVDNALASDPSIFSRSLGAQMEVLILEPLKIIFLSGGQEGHADRRTPRLIILDGLDECGTPKAQQYVLKVISSFIHRSPIPIKFLITSRFEQELRDSFSTEPLCSYTARLALDDTHHPDDDIRRFLIDRFDSLKSSHPLRSMLPQVWPTAEEVGRLVQKSSGQFIYAATVVQFVSSRRRKPDEQLQIIFGIGNAEDQTPFAHLDALYRQIFASVEKGIFPRALEIIGCLFAMAESFESTENAITLILQYQRGDVQLILTDLHSVLDVPELSATDDQPPIHVSHSSLKDFLVDSKRAGDLYIDERKSHATIAQWILQQQNWVKFPTSLGFFLLRNHSVKSQPTTDLLHEFSHFRFEGWVDQLLRGVSGVSVPFLWESRKAMFQVSVWLRKQESNMDEHSGTGSRQSEHPLDEAIDRISRHLVKPFAVSEDGNNQITAFMHPRFIRMDRSAIFSVLTYERKNTILPDFENLISSIPEDDDGSKYVLQLQEFLGDRNRAWPYSARTRMFSTLPLQIAKFIFGHSQLEDAGDRAGHILTDDAKATENAMLWAIESLPFYLSIAGYTSAELSDYLLGHNLKIGKLYPKADECQRSIDTYLKKRPIKTREPHPTASQPTVTKPALEPAPKPKSKSKLIAVTAASPDLEPESNHDELIPNNEPISTRQPNHNRGPRQNRIPNPTLTSTLNPELNHNRNYVSELRVNAEPQGQNFETGIFKTLARGFFSWMR